MNRGFNSNHGQGARPNFGQQHQNVVDYRERANQSDRRYDDFYSGGGANNNRGGGGGGNWNGPQQQIGFNNQTPARGGVGAGAINVSGQALSAIQQQSLINALVSNQQQLNSIVPQNQFQGMGQQNRFQNQQGGGFRRGGGAMGRGGFASGNIRPGDKRNISQSGGNFNRQQGGKKVVPKVQPKKFKEMAKDSPKKTVKTPAPKPVVVVEEEIEIPDDEVVVPDTLKESVEKLRARTDEIDRNAVDEDVDKLRVFSFTGKGYHCITCDIVLSKETSFTNHLSSKNHVMKVIDARTAKKYKATRDILDIDLADDDWFDINELAHSIILKQAKVDMRISKAKELRAAAEYNKTPSNFYKFNMELRKSVIKQDDEVVITSLVESTVGVKDFAGGKFFGCEFVRAVTGFHCRLCSINIREAKGVLPHIETKLHKNNYASYLTKNPDYEKMQLGQNQDLHDIMSQHDDKSVVLAESRNAETSPFLSLLDDKVVRIPSVMDPELKKKEAAAKAKAEAEEKGEGSKDDAEAEGSKDNAEAEGSKDDAEAEESKDDAEAEEAKDDENDAEEAVDEAEEPMETTEEPETEEAVGEEDEAKEEKDAGENSDVDPYAEIETPKEEETLKKTPAVSKSKVKKLVAKVKGK